MDEPEHSAERYGTAYTERSVRVSHHEDGTGDLYGNNLPSVVLADIEDRLDREAKAIGEGVSDGLCR